MTSKPNKVIEDAIAEALETQPLEAPLILDIPLGQRKAKPGIALPMPPQVQLQYRKPGRPARPPANCNPIKIESLSTISPEPQAIAKIDHTLEDIVNGLKLKRKA